jgi:hydrogenase maturation protein HypF
MHPDYASTHWARASGKPVIAVQHHMAHAAACAAEKDIRGEYLAVAWDGTGYGLDGTIWGGEFFVVNEGRFERVAHLRPFMLPGGDAAVRESWRSAASLKWALGETVEQPIIRRMLERKLNCPETTSVGRLFDAVASITGIAQRSLFEGEAAMLLERAARRASYCAQYKLDGDWGELITSVLRDVRAGVDAGAIARGFHAALADWVLTVARRTGVRQVVLTGGVFQNALLTAMTAERLSVYTHQRIPPNDGGIALGQAVLAGLQLR